MNIKKLMLGACVALSAMVALTSCGAKDAAKDAAGTEEAVEEQVAEETAAVAQPVTVLAEGEQVAPAGGKLIVMDFNATWCGPCKKFTPNFEAVAARYADKAMFYEIDVDIHPDIAAQYDVQSIPMVVFVHPDGKVNSFNGYKDEAEFDAIVAENLQ